MASSGGETKRVFFQRLLIVLIPACTGLPAGDVFVSGPKANAVLHRSRRANFLFEELKKGNLERECLEERCSYEEAKEIFALPQQLESFWRRYTAVDPCQASPCKNGATCTRHIENYVCKCPHGYHGRNCDRARVTSHNCHYRNGGCEHFCKYLPDRSHICFCAPGYRLNRKDNSSCLPEDDVVCGQPKITFAPRVVGGEICPKGHCPWQALLTMEHKFQCGAIVLSTHWILTAAHCVPDKTESLYQVIVGKHDRNLTEKTEQERQVAQVLVHPSYNRTNYDSDLALLRLQHPIKLNRYVVPICLPARNSTFSRTLATVRHATVSGWGKQSMHGSASTLLKRVVLPRVPLQECRLHSGLTITRNMICAGYRTGGRDSCRGDSGGPLVTLYGRTWFLTGVVSWGHGCAQANLYGVYVKVSNFLLWIAETTST